MLFSLSKDFLDGLLQAAPGFQDSEAGHREAGELQEEVAERSMKALVPSQVFLASALWRGTSAHLRGDWVGLQSGSQSRTGEGTVFRDGGPKARSPSELCETSGFEGLHLEKEEKLWGNSRALAAFPGEQQVPAARSSGSREFVGRDGAWSEPRPGHGFLGKALL